MLKSGIYKILNKLTGKFYIGSAIYIKHRFGVHRSKLRNNKHQNIHLQRAWNKCWSPEIDFEFVILEFCEIEKLIEREQFYFDTLKPEYNIVPFAGHTLGYKHTEEDKIKMSILQTGRKHSDEHRFNIGNSHKGQKRSEEAKLNMSLASKGKPKSEEHRAKISAFQKGIKRSEEFKLKVIKNKRRVDQWPHELGCKCKCKECRNKRNAQKYAAAKKDKYEIMTGFEP